MCGCVPVRGAAALNLKGPMTFAVFSFIVFYNMFSFAFEFQNVIVFSYC